MADMSDDNNNDGIVRTRREEETRKRKERRRRARLSAIQKDIEDMQTISSCPNADTHRLYNCILSLSINLQSTLQNNGPDNQRINADDDEHGPDEQRKIAFAQFEAAKGIEATISAMRFYDPMISYVCCDILQMVSQWYNRNVGSDWRGKRSYHNRKTANLERLGAYGAVKRAIYHIPHDKELCLSVIAALNCFGALIEKKSIFRDWKLFDSVLEAFQRFGADDVLFSSAACALISHFCGTNCGDNDRQWYGTKRGACALVYNALLLCERGGGADNDVNWCMEAIQSLTKMKHLKKKGFRLLTREAFVALGADKLLTEIANNRNRSNKTRTNANNALKILFTNYVSTY
jgi:hypothetical protein